MAGRTRPRPMSEQEMIDVALRRIVYREGHNRQYIYLMERKGTRHFPIVIGSSEAGEIKRIVENVSVERPLTHQLCFDSIEALGAHIKQVDIVDLRHNTFFARVVIEAPDGAEAAVDARPSDAIALALRAGCRIRVADAVLTSASEEHDDSAE